MADLDLTQFIEQFHFLRPWWLLALIPSLLLIIAIKKMRLDHSSWQKVIDHRLLPYLLEKQWGKNNLLPLWLLLLGWFISVFAMAGPTWSKNPELVQTKEDALVIVLDLSLSMYAKDVKPSRLERAKFKLHDLLLQREEGLTALVVYAGDSYVVSPLTDDIATIDSLVPSLTPDIMPAYGSNLAQAIEDANQLLVDGNITVGRILVITDGIQENQAESITRVFDPRYTVSILGVGSLDGAPIPTNDGSYLKDRNGVIVIAKLNRRILEQVSAQSGGFYAELSLNDSDLNYVLTPIKNELNAAREIERDFDVWQEQGPLLILLLIPLAAMAFRRGWLLQILVASSIVGFGGISSPSYALGWDDLWWTKDQQGARARANGENAKAAGLFESQPWKGAAHYDSEDYQQALAAFAADQGLESLYNQGNTYARLGEYQKAIDNYEKVLSTHPDHEDAKFNKELIEKLLEQQQQEQQQQQQQQQQQDQEGEQQQDQQQDGSGQQNQGDEEQQGQGQQDAQDDSDAQQRQGEQEGEQQPQDQEQQQAKNSQGESEDGDAQANASLSPEDQMSEEQQQALEQWLRRVPDDPGGLLRRKFKYQYEQKRRPKSQPGQPVW